MKKLFPIIFAVLALVSLIGCTQPTTPTEPTAAGVYVKDSAWSPVSSSALIDYGIKSRRLPAMMSRDVAAELSLSDVKAIVAEHNAASTDDQWVILDSDVPVELAPDAPAWVTNTATLDIYWHATVKRADLEAQREAWRKDLEIWPNPDGSGAFVPVTLYVDNIPPEPPVIVVPGPKLHVALYNTTTKLYYYAESYELESSAWSRYNSFTYAVEQNNADPTVMGPGVWAAYWGDKPFPEAYPDYSPGTLP